MTLKRLLIISSEFPPGPGGIGTHAYHVAKALSEGGWQVAVLTPQDYVPVGEIEVFNRQQDFEIHTLAKNQFKPLQLLKRFISIWRFLDSFKPHLVLATGSRAAWISGLLLTMKKIPWVLVGHGSEFGTDKGWRVGLTRISSNRASTVICVSDYTLGVMRAMGITKPPAMVIHNGADHYLYHPLPKVDVKILQDPDISYDKFILLTVGNVSDRKGQEVVIRALPRITAFHPNVVYWMAGLPTRQAQLESLAFELGVSKNIKFWGRVSEEKLVELYNSCDLFMMTSRQLTDGDFEGYGIAVTEAALCGKAAVVSDNSGLAEAVIDGETGVLVPQDDPAAVAEVVLALISDEDRLARLGLAAQKRAEACQTWVKVGILYQDVLENVLEKRA